MMPNGSAALKNNCAAPLMIAEPIANWRALHDDAEMTTSQFDQWCRDGKPALVARKCRRAAAFTSGDEIKG